MKLVLSVLCCVALAACGSAVPGSSMGERRSTSTKDTGDGHKVTICHATSSAKNPFVVITIDTAGLAGHIPHHDGDVLWSQTTGCNVCGGVVEAPVRTTACTSNDDCGTDPRNPDNSDWGCWKDATGFDPSTGEPIWAPTGVCQPGCSSSAQCGGSSSCSADGSACNQYGNCLSR